MSVSALYPRAATWLFGKLTAPEITGVGVHVYEENAPEGTVTRDDVWIQFEVMAPGSDVAEVAEQRIWTEFAFQIVACKRGRSTQELKVVADTIYERLHRSDGTADGAYVISATRSDEVVGSDLAQGVEYRMLGGIYNLIVQPA